MYFIKTATICSGSWSLVLILGIVYFSTDKKTDFYISDLQMLNLVV